MSRQLVLRNAAGETWRIPMKEVLSLGRLDQIEKLELVGSEPIWFTWIEGRCERLSTRPGEADRYVVRTADLAFACQSVDME